MGFNPWKQTAGAETSKPIRICKDQGKTCQICNADGDCRSCDEEGNDRYDPDIDGQECLFEKETFYCYPEQEKQCLKCPNEVCLSQSKMDECSTEEAKTHCSITGELESEEQIEEIDIFGWSVFCIGCIALVLVGFLSCNQNKYKYIRILTICLCCLTGIMCSVSYIESKKSIGYIIFNLFCIVVCTGIVILGLGINKGPFMWILNKCNKSGEASSLTTTGTAPTASSLTTTGAVAAGTSS